VEDYGIFLAKKTPIAEPVGFSPVAPINSKLFRFQHDIAKWALERGRAAVFIDCGLGKSAIELEWGHHTLRWTGKPILLLTPLAVAKQMGREAEKFGIPDVKVCRTNQEIEDGKINVLNYERLGDLSPDRFGGLILDESSIIKAWESVTRKILTQFAKSIPFRLAATATPAPNDLIELTNHAEFLDIMTGKEVIAQFFTQDGNTTQKYRLKKHAVTPFWQWLASWSVAARKPSDLGDVDGNFILPELRIHDVQVDSPPPPGFLFGGAAQSLSERRQSRKNSLPDRAKATADLVASEPSHQWVIWCDLNAEADELKKLIPDAVEIRGTENPDVKEDKMSRFLDGSIRVLISKPTICGFGVNMQCCSKVVFCGLSDSYEQQYQAIRRFYRFGQEKPVDVYFVSSEAEGVVVENVRRKERQAVEMFDRIVEHMRGYSIGQQSRDRAVYNPSIPMQIPSWLGVSA